MAKNIQISMKILDELVYAVRSYADELGEARDNCTLQEDIDSLGARIDELGKLVKFCERAKTVAEAGRESQTETRVRPHRGKCPCLSMSMVNLAAFMIRLIDSHNPKPPEKDLRRFFNRLAFSSECERELFYQTHGENA